MPNRKLSETKVVVISKENMQKVFEECGKILRSNYQVDIIRIVAGNKEVVGTYKLSKKECINDVFAKIGKDVDILLKTGDVVSMRYDNRRVTIANYLLPVLLDGDCSNANTESFAFPPGLLHVRSRRARG